MMTVMCSSSAKLTKCSQILCEMENVKWIQCWADMTQTWQFLSEKGNLRFSEKRIHTNSRLIQNQ